MRCALNISYGSLFSTRDKQTRRKFLLLKRERLIFAVGWEDSELFPEGLILKLLLARETINSSLRDETLKLFFFAYKIYKLDGVVLHDLNSSLPVGYSLFLSA